MKQIPGTDKVCKLETNIDDSTGEVLGHVMELLMSHGAKDVHYVPVMMKRTDLLTYSMYYVMKVKEKN